MNNSRLNYSTNFLEDYNQFWSKQKMADNAIRFIRDVAICIKTGVKFMLPENGELLASSWEMKKGMPLKLPFPVCILEYTGARNTDHADNRFQDGPSKWKAITVAREGSFNDLDGFFIVSSVKIEELVDIKPKWITLPGSIFLPYQQDISVPEGMFPYRFLMGDGFPFWVVEETQEYGKEQFAADMIIDANAAINLCACLACNNVDIETIPAPVKLNMKRSKTGRLPFFEYKVLTLNQATKHVGNNYGGTHSSPRLHLRRGHVRQYKPNLFTWVNPSVVGNKTKGLIVKDYIITRS